MANPLMKSKQGKFPTYQSHLSSLPPSSSSSSSNPDFEYDVFISFRGKDTRKRFTTHLYSSLEGNGISTFMDDEELETGKAISPELLRAIKNSRLFIIVLSENYADSRWCLDELVHIIENLRPKSYIIPIFYDVDPTVVRHQKNSYAIAFSDHEKKYKDQVDKINRWRLALTAVANISGWHLNDQSEVQFIEYIVKEVFRKLGDTSRLLDELDTTIELVNRLKGTYKGFSGAISHEFRLRKSDDHRQHGFRYDVFLSCRGENTRNHFVDNLYHALHRHGIATFRVDETLRMGSEIVPQLLQAIKNSKLSIVILSRNYASSAWCLEELVHILECRKKVGNQVLPIFYGVDPNAVRHQTDSYGEAFAEHEERFNLEKVKKWRDALRKVTNLTSRHLDKRHEVDLIDDIVRTVSRQLRALVGMAYQLNKLNSYLDSDVNDVRIIGLWGVAGIGKTTIMEVNYNMISENFEVCCLLANVKEESLRFGLTALQQQLLRRLPEVPEKISVRDVQHGIGLIRDHFCSKRVLLILDNVDKLDQLEALAGDSSWFGSGSRIIITTRDKNLLASLKGVKMCEIEGLNHGEASELFSFHAFGQNQQLEHYDMLCRHVVEYANGNPLTLKGIGRFLFGKNINEWIYSLNNIKSLRKNQIFNTLRISYDSLDEESKAIFLYISCFLDSKNVDRVSEVLDCCGYPSKIGMESLIDISFITVSNNIVRMHPFAQKMGWKIVHRECTSKPVKCRILWHHRDITEVTSRNSGTESVEAIVLDNPELEGHWNRKAFTSLCNLKLLSIRSNIHLPEGLEYLPQTLRLLKWRRYPLKSLPPDFCPSQLVELKMCHSQIEQLWWEEKLFNDLKCINLSHSRNLTKTPDFTWTPNLEKLILEGCTSLVEVHPSFGTLKRLRILNLKDCISLRSLQCAAMSLESLQICFLSGCSKLEHIDQLVARLVLGSPNILKLSLRNCDLEEGAIPSDIGCCLTSLEVLDIGRNKFSSLPKSIRQLNKLKFLGLAHCNQLKSVPELPSNVEYVEARDCSSLHTFSNPSNVRTSIDFVLSFINCFNLAQNKDCRSTALTWLKAYLGSLMPDNQNQELSQLSGRFDIIVPGTRIPEWFRHQNNMGPSVTIPLPPNRNNRNWIGFAFCVVFIVHQNYSEEESSSIEINCQLYADESRIGNRFGFCISNNTALKSDHLWLRYVSNGSIGKRMLRWNRIGQITASFETESHCLEVKKCGLRAVYKQDMEEKNKRKFQYICSPTEDLGVGFFSNDK
ncbi:disease resistance protein RPV1-like isoform X2 [Ziziphus jujuba]|uniref:ADP-ribosyl cyclase/cyclic ADP-ribose hydrolase n=1 Tax=Ziziphus jujuba TaxID=326968 RepID=A0ABM3IC77_ZIZJJ|nr:disease resistance protein RPV1-like isoform X2 [Ziziphus jujuba]